MAARALTPAEAVAAVAGWALLEVGLARALPRPPSAAAALAWTGAIRLGELALAAAWWRVRGFGPGRLGLGGAPARTGVRTGLAWAGAFGAAAFGTEAIVRLTTGQGWLGALAGPRLAPDHLAWLLLVGALVAPAFEEFLFRGVLYGSFRDRWGPWPALAGSTVVFALAHLGTAAVPWTQVVGGVVFCLAYERAGSLWAPYLVHAAGNACLFLLPWIVG
ncbi:CPBP family intramembrane glutamic endopeptidase [Deferrisoma palaeochoriense]